MSTGFADGLRPSANAYPGVQFYPVCVQVEVTGEGTAFPTSFVSFPGAYTPDTRGMMHLRQLSS